MKPLLAFLLTISVCRAEITSQFVMMDLSMTKEDGKPLLNNCIGLRFRNNLLGKREVEKLLHNEFLIKQGEAYCDLVQSLCKTKCIPLVVDGGAE